MPETIYLTDGALDFAGGVDSGKLPLLQSASNPNGLRRDQLAWLDNGTVRGGGITQRATWKFLTEIADASALYQGGYLYEPREATPFFVFSIGGRLLRFDASAGAVKLDLSTVSGLVNPANVERAYFCQGEEFLLIQAGDWGLVPIPTLPLFYDAHTLWRSRGITGDANPANPLTNNEIPAATFMDYYMQRFWYAQSRITSAGDIVGGPSGTVTYGQRDSILHVTENPLALGGDGFAVPTHAGPIRALAHTAAIDTTLGEGQLCIFTRKDIYALKVPVTRAEWTTSTEPLQRVIQKKYGTGADRSVVAVNGDLFYQTLEPGIRTLALAVRYFSQWANTPISRNINRVLNFNNRGLLRFGSGMLFDNRLFQTCLPYETPVGVAHKALAALDFDLISGFQDKLASNQIPSWEGISEGLNILQVFSGDFGGLERAFATVYSEKDNNIQLWELSTNERFENGDNRVTWYFETPSFPFNDPFQLKELMAGDIWIDRIYGQVEIKVEYRSDDDSCWHFWAQFNECTARTSCEDTENPVCYPLTTYGEAAGKPFTLPHPPQQDCSTNRKRPAYLGHAFQLRVTIKGFCRWRGELLYASPVQRALYQNQIC